MRPACTQARSVYPVSCLLRCGLLASGFLALSGLAHASDACTNIPGGIEKGAASFFANDQGASTCLISVAQMVSDLDKHVLIDLRRPAEVAELRIPGVVNLDIRDIESSPFIPTGSVTVVLLGDVREMPRMLRACQSATSPEGRVFRVLAGGLKAWRDAGGALVGDVESLDSDRDVTVSMLQEFFSLPGIWLVNDSNFVRPEALSAKWADALGQVPDAAASELRSELGEGQPPAILVLLDPLAGQERRAAWKRALLAVDLPEPIFYMKGENAYKAWAEQQSGVNEQRSRPMNAGCRWN